MSALPGHPIGLLGSGIFCLFLAVLVLIKVIVPRWRKKWGWGKGPGYPISVFGHIGILVALLLISSGSLAVYFEKMDPNLAFFLPLSGFVVFIVTGLADTHRSKKGVESRHKDNRH